MANKHSVTLPRVVDKIIESPDPEEPERAQINIQDGADPLYREIRIKNSLTDEHGEEVAFKEGEELEVAVEAEKADTAGSENETPHKTKRSLQAILKSSPGCRRVGRHDWSLVSTEIV